MKDFIGTDIKGGDFVAKGGAGNLKAEYGMVAYLVLGMRNNKLQVLRLKVDYVGGKSPGVITVKKSTITNPNSVIVFSPTVEIKHLFAAAMKSTVTPDEAVLIGNWIHGADHQHPWGV
jgi:hypothetical protein